MFSHFTKAMCLVLAIMMPLTLSACLGKTIKHGQIISQEKLSQIHPGSSEEQVLLVLGTPSTVGMSDEKVFYYFSQEKRQVSFLKPQTINQRVIAIYFGKNKKVRSISEYGLKEGKLFDFNKNETETIGRDYGLLNQILSGAQTPALGLPGQ